MDTQDKIRAVLDAVAAASRDWMPYDSRALPDRMAARRDFYSGVSQVLEKLEHDLRAAGLLLPK